MSLLKGTDIETFKPEPGIYLVPLAVAEPDRIRLGDPGVLSRRIPDFLCYALNGGGVERTALLEIRSSPGEGSRAEWFTFTEPPDAEDVLEMVPGETPTAVVTGTLEPHHDGLNVSLTVARSGMLGGTETFSQTVSAKDPADSCLRLARSLAHRLAIDVPRVPWAEVGTRNSKAFFSYLEGLDGAAAHDAGMPDSTAPLKLIAPFLEALRLDPGFALAVRQVHLFLAQGLQEGSLPKDQCLEILDRLLMTRPTDGLAALSVGEQLAAMGEDSRAEAWLELACSVSEPPPRALEGLGILLANRGDLIAARDLWLRGVASDGHPDFFAHLARLAFCEGDEVEGWDKVLRGLRRISERCLRPSEWDEDSPRAGILLQYLPEHLAALDSPEDVHVALADLAGAFEDPDDRVDLGLCFKEIGKLTEAEREIRGGLPHVQDRDRRDAGARVLLLLGFPGFDKRLERAVDLATEGATPEAALEELVKFSDSVPVFWPAWFFRGVVHRRLGKLPEAKTCLERALALRGDQAETLNELAVVSDELGDTTRALDLVEEAQQLSPDEAVYHVNRAVFLKRVGRKGDALVEIERAMELSPGDPTAKKMEKELRENPDA